mmetsp:Transcript_25308/g.27641  ORF Transcript_25308/g.27641 Transcript_25308/m.27641 type:complete len:236 (-) Transcript_25308:40-747(-)
MEEKTKMAIILGILIPSAIIITVLAIIWLVRRIQYWRTYGGYNQVQHDLDEEEIEFKRMLDSKNDFNYEYEDEESGIQSDEDFEKLINSKFNPKSKGKKSEGEKTSYSSRSNIIDRNPHKGKGGEDDEDFDFEFSAKERDRLSLLEKFRSNLVAEADHHPVVPSSSTAVSHSDYLSLPDEGDEPFSHNSDTENHVTPSSDPDPLQNHHPELKATFDELNKFYTSDSDQEIESKEQ